MPNNMKYYVEISLRSTGDYVLQSKWYDTYLEAVEFIGTLDFIDYNVVIVDIMKAKFSAITDEISGDIENELLDIQINGENIEDINEEIADSEYVYIGMSDERIAELLHERYGAPTRVANEYVRLYAPILESIRKTPISKQLAKMKG